MEDKKIIRNRAKCLLCEDIITSYSVHDYKECKCKRISVDGGTFYIRRGFQKVEDYEDMSVFEDSPFEIVRENFHWGTYGKSGKENLKWVPLYEMTDEHISNILGDDREQGGQWVRKLFVKEMSYRITNNIKIMR